MADIDFIMAMSCAPSALLGLYKYKRMEPVFHPFILTLILSVFTELASKVMKDRVDYTLFYPLANFYLLVNVLLFYEFFIRTKTVSHTRRWFYATVFISSLITEWVFVSDPLHKIPFWSLIIYSLFILTPSVKLLSMQVFETRVKLFQNPLFYISAGCIIFYTYTIFTGIIYLFIPVAKVYDWYIFKVDKIINLLHYALFLMATVWMSRKK